jgi:fatty-acyl-CoA synthase
MLSYYEMPDETAATIDDDGWLHMGDLGTMDDRGFLRVTGRLKDMIIRGGMNIYPREIEELLFSHPGVAEVAVIGLPDERWGEQVAAVVRPKDPAAPPSPEELRDWCRERISSHKTPARWFFTQAYPMTPSGKVQKFALKDQIDAGTLVPAPVSAAPTTAPAT